MINSSYSLCLVCICCVIALSVKGQGQSAGEWHQIRLKPNQAIQYRYMEVPVYDLFTFLPDSLMNRQDSLMFDSKLMLDSLIVQLKASFYYMNFHYINRATNVADDLLIRYLIEDKKITRVDTFGYRPLHEKLVYAFEPNQFLKTFRVSQGLKYRSGMVFTQILPTENVADDSLHEESKRLFKNILPFIPAYRCNISEIWIRYIYQFGMKPLGEYTYTLPSYYQNLF